MSKQNIKVFRKKFGVCLKRVKEQNLKVTKIPSIWKIDINNDSFISFFIEADKVLTKVSSICLEEGLELYIDFNSHANEDWSLVSLVNGRSMFDCDDNSDAVVDDFYTFLNSIYKACGIPIVILLFSCAKSKHKQLKTIHINSDT